MHILNKRTDIFHRNAAAASRTRQVNAVGTGIDQPADDFLCVIVRGRIAKHLFIDAVFPLAGHNDHLITEQFLREFCAGNDILQGGSASRISAQDDEVRPDLCTFQDMFFCGDHSFPAVQGFLSAVFRAGLRAAEINADRTAGTCLQFLQRKTAHTGVVIRIVEIDRIEHYHICAPRTHQFGIGYPADKTGTRKQQMLAHDDTGLGFKD